MLFLYLDGFRGFCLLFFSVVEGFIFFSLVVLGEEVRGEDTLGFCFFRGFNRTVFVRLYYKSMCVCIRW